MVAKLELEVVVQDVTWLKNNNSLAVRGKRIKIRKEDDSKMRAVIYYGEKGGDKCWGDGKIDEAVMW